MIPFFFGASERQLFGIYHPGSGREKRGVVLCNPWGQEYLRAHQSMRFLAGLISEAGHHVLRFDWFGTGDSAGTSFEGGNPDAWVDDLSEAIDELKDMANLRSVSLVGIRLGAAPVARVAPGRKDVKKVVLWDPILDGREYLSSLLNRPGVQDLSGNPDLPENHRGEEVFEVMGFPITPPVREGMEAIHPLLLGSGLPPTLLISTVPDPERYSGIEKALQDSDVENSFETFGGPEAWIEEGDFGTSGMPVVALRRISDWVT